MKIGIEGQRLFRVKKHGMDMVALELVRNLQEIDTRNEYFIFIKPDEDDQVLKESANFHIVRLEGGAYPWWEQVALPRAARAAGCDLLHCTSNTAPAFCDLPLVITLHDIIYLESSYIKILQGSGTPYQKFGNIYRRLIVPRVIRKSKAVITVSEFERKRIGEFFSMSGDSRLTAIYNGVGTHFKPVTDQTVLDHVRRKYHLPGRFFFFLGNTDPKKNTRGTLAAYSSFLKQTGEDIKLVMLDYDRDALNQLVSDIGDRTLTDHIILTGYVNNADLPAIYSQCDLFLYPSLRESFGIPILEAMACAVPVITGNTSSMPEIAGNAALLINPHQPEEITGAMIRLTKDQQLHQQFSDLGRIRAASFSWRNMAENVLQLYQSVVDKKNDHPVKSKT